MTPISLLLAYCALVLVASLAGGLIPLVLRLTHTRLQVAISFVAGFMLGIGTLHLLPHAWSQLGSMDQVVGWMLAGFVVMFFIQRFFHFHHHDVPEDDHSHDHEHAPDHEHGHDHHHHHEHEESQSRHEHLSLAHQSARNLSWSGAALGLTLHTLIDGVAVAASVAADSRAQAVGGLLGFGAFLVVILHKPFDAMAIGTLMAVGGRSRSSRHWANGLFALAFPLGALLFYLGASHYSGSSQHFVGFALAFTAGTFVCIAASDLLPELQFHSHDRIKLSVALIIGLALSAVIGRIEHAGHDHDHPPPPHEHKDEVKAPVN